MPVGSVGGADALDAAKGSPDPGLRGADAPGGLDEFKPARIARGRSYPAGVAGAEGTPPPASDRPASLFWRGGRRYEVVDVIGGEGLVVRDGDKQMRIRYLGLRAPEAGTPLALEAAQMNRRLLARGGVRVVFDRRASGAGVRKAYVFARSPGGAGETLVNAYLLQHGYARFDKEGLEPRYQGYFAEIESRAKARGAGAWPKVVADSTPVAKPNWIEDGLDWEKLERIRSARRPRRSERREPSGRVKE